MEGLRLPDPIDAEEIKPVARFGLVLAGAQPFSFNGNINTVYRGQVYCSDGATVSAFIKDIDAREFGNELLAAALGLHLGLPIPRPIVARVRKGVMPASKLPLTNSEDFLVFASADANAKPVLQVLQEAGALPPAVLARLGNWGQLGGLYGFDTWIANIDRHRGNILLTGGDEVWLIDHGQCFTAPSLNAQILQPEASYRNRLREWLTPALSGAKRAGIAGQASCVGSGIAGAELEAIARANFVRLMIGDDFDTIRDFLTARAAHVPHQSTDALGLLI